MSSATEPRRNLELVDVPHSGPMFDAVVSLGDRCRATLGFLPRAVFADKALKKTLVGAVKNGQLVGYACFELTKRWVRLIHLCVAPDMRRHHIARTMIDFLSQRYADYPGILARCRNDYGLAPVWTRLGFLQRTEVTGRSHEGRPLTVWWLDHGHPTLFSELTAEPQLQAALDLCIVRDLSSDTDRPEAADTRTLVADHVVDRLQLVRTPVLAEEISTLDDARKRQPCVNFSSARLTDAKPVGEGTRHIEEKLVASARRLRGAYPSGDSDEYDVRHVAATIAAGVSVFVTRDDQLIRMLSPGAAEFGVRILTPSDVMVHLDELAEAASFRPAALAGTAYRRQRIGSGHDDVVMSLVNRTAKENPRQFLQRWRRAAAERHGRFGIYDPGDVLVAAWVTEAEAGCLRVSIVRVGTHRLAETLARQVVHMLREQARRARLPVVTVTDPHVPHAVRSALADNGFAEINGIWSAFCIDICADANAVEAEAVRAAQQSQLPHPIRLRAHMPAIATAMIERAWWPAKIVDADIPCYLVPIQQRYSSLLFGEPESLFQRTADLGLSREHVYYRSPRPKLKAPARILWYMSGTGQQVLPQGAFACSQLDTVVTGTPEDLHERFQHLGVWNLEQLHQAARDRSIQALRFSSTEIFDTPVPLTRIKELVQYIPQGPISITSGTFKAIYDEGRRGA